MRERGAFVRLKMKEWLFASFKAQSCPLLRTSNNRLWPYGRPAISSFRTAIFRQVNKDRAHTHHDALEFPDGKIVLLTTLRPGQQATVLQLPAEPQQARREPVAKPAEMVEFERLG